MAKSSVMVSLPQMVDLALNCPEVGAVNFNILHSLLHVLIQQVDLLECKVEFRGDESERVQSVIAASKPGPTINLTEYIVTPGKDQRKVVQKRAKYKKVKGDKKSSKEEVIVEQELRVIEQRKDSKEEPITQPAPMLSADRLDSTSMQTVVVVETADASNAATPHVSVALSRVHFDNIEDELEKLKEEVKELKELPANMGLIDALRNSSVDKSSPVLDMFQILTLVKRVDATETGIGKLASMLEDLAREQASLAASGGGRLSQGIVKRASDLQVAVKDSKLGGVTLSGEVKEKIDHLEKRVEKLEKGGGGSPGRGSTAGVGTETGEIKEEGIKTDASSEERLTDLEIKFAEYTEQVTELDTIYNNQINVLQQQFTDLEKEIGEIVERINAGLPGGDMGADQNVPELYNKIIQLQEDMEQMTNTAAKLLADREERQQSMDVIVEQIELLKTIKANREDLEDALADKADACTVNRKVSHDQFDAACDDLARGIEDALLKLTQQERLWQVALDDIQTEIENKLDKVELTPLRDFVHNKLKMLQERLKALAALKRETEAAGTKSKFLRNVNCISCDRDVIMRKNNDPTLAPPPPALPATKSIAPYLAYELDALRKQQKCMPHSRNMNHFESAMSGGKGKGDEDHICNRYCGGSHTVTTPQQRVARLGHFLQQWGPETQSVNEGTIRGTDGQMYKAREGGDMTPGRLPQMEESESDYFPPSDMRARPSMVVHGGILATRSTLRSATSRISEEEHRPSVSVKAPERRESQQPAGEQRPSASARKDSQRVSISATPRASKDAPSSRRASRASAGRASQSRASASKHASRVSIKEEAPPAEGGEAEPAPAEGEAAPPAEEAAPPAEGEAAAEAAPAEEEAAPPAEEPAPEEAPAEAEPAAEAAPAED